MNDIGFGGKTFCFSIGLEEVLGSINTVKTGAPEIPYTTHRQNLDQIMLSRQNAPQAIRAANGSVVTQASSI